MQRALFALSTLALLCCWLSCGEARLEPGLGDAAFLQPDAAAASIDAAKPEDAANLADATIFVPADAAGPKDATAFVPVDAAAAGLDAAMPIDAGPCLEGMVFVDPYCIDRYEAYVVEIDDAGAESPHSPFDVIGNATVRAKVAGGVMPQGYISQAQATQACANASKRLCTGAEFRLACEGWPDGGAYYPYGGRTHLAGYYNEGKGSSMPRFFGSNPALWTYAEFNDPRLNEWDGGLAPTGSFPKCVSPYGLYDCVGNLHEWGSDPADVNGHGRFRGGFYGDAEYNGPGCTYVTSAHELTYHDYSTGFRCCADP